MTLWTLFVGLSLAAPPQEERVDQVMDTEPGVIFVAEKAKAWGTPLLVDTLNDVADRLAWILPDADPLFIGDLSRRGGGALPPHKTHDRGIDVDIGLFLKGRRQPLGGFRNVGPDALDLEATWILIRELLATGNVKFILLDQAHIDALRRYLINDRGLPVDEVDRVFLAEDSTVSWRQHGVVRHAPSHLSHLHVHVARPADVL